jgi:hypothetical protein
LTTALTLTTLARGECVVHIATTIHIARVSACVIRPEAICDGSGRLLLHEVEVLSIAALESIRGIFNVIGNGDFLRRGLVTTLTLTAALILTTALAATLILAAAGVRSGLPTLILALTAALVRRLAALILALTAALITIAATNVSGWAAVAATLGIVIARGSE